jgi:hypothetical protein
MAFIGSALGAGYTSDWSPTGQVEQLQNPNVTPGQLGHAGDMANSAIAQQQAFANAVSQQNGLGNQNSAFQGYQNLANGTGANPAQAQLAQATSANVANQAAMAAGQRGASQNVGMMARGAANQGANIQQQAAGQAATMGAQQQLSGLQGMSGIANAQVGQQQGAIQGLNSAAQGEQANLYGAQGAYNNAMGSIMGSQNTANASIQLQNDKNKSGMFGGLLSGAGGVLSDERLKTDIKPAGDKIKAFLDAAGAHEYKYKGAAKSMAGGDDKTHIGPMAQELEKSELGSQMVDNGPQGKSVDFQRGLGTIVAAQAALNKRLEALEGSGKGKKAEKAEKPKKMAEGGAVKGQFGIPQFGGAIGNGMAGQNQQGQPQTAEGAVSKGGQDLMKGLTDKFVKPYTDPYLDSIKRSVTDFFHPGAALSSNPSYTGPQGALSGQTPAPSTGPGLGADTNLSAAEAPGQTGMESLGGEGATDAAAGGAAEAGAMDAGATEAAGGAADAAAAGEAAEAAEGGSAIADVAMLASKGGKIPTQGKKVPVMVSPGEAYIPPQNVKAVAEGKASVRDAGIVIPGKPKVKGDSQKNDTVPTKLAPGGVVVKRTAMDHDAKAAAFVQSVLAKSGNLRRGKK